MKKIALLAFALGLFAQSNAAISDHCSECSINLALNTPSAKPEQKAPTREPIKEISLDDLKKKVDDPNYKGKIVNVLGRRFWEDARIPKSISAPLKELEEICKKWDKNQEIIVYCAARECDASYKAYKILEANGFTNLIANEDGIRGWFQKFGKEGTEGPCEYKFLKQDADGNQILTMKDCALKTVLLEIYWGIRG
jgi:rhodanese-related sulfurtransferase